MTKYTHFLANFSLVMTNKVIFIKICIRLLSEVSYSIMTSKLLTSDSLFLLLSRLLYITEGKYWNQLKKFRVVLSSGCHETRSTAKKVTASESAKPGPRIHTYFFNSGVTGTCRNGDKE